MYTIRRAKVLNLAHAQLEQLTSDLFSAESALELHAIAMAEANTEGATPHASSEETTSSQ
jgi:hypothetical protein